jgi:hypothetical protein
MSNVDSSLLQKMRIFGKYHVGRLALSKVRNRNLMSIFGTHHCVLHCNGINLPCFNDCRTTAKLTCCTNILSDSKVLTAFLDFALSTQETGLFVKCLFLLLFVHMSFTIIDCFLNNTCKSHNNRVHSQIHLTLVGDCGPGSNKYIY